MKLPNKYGYGTLFGFSGLEGENSKNEDFIGMTMSEPITVRFDSAHPVSLFIPADCESFEFILSDVIKSDKALLAFADCESVVGRSEAAPSVFGDFGRIAPSDGETAIFENDGFFFALSRSGEGKAPS